MNSQSLAIARVHFFIHSVTHYLSSQKDLSTDVLSLQSLLGTCAKKQVLVNRLACCDAVAVAEGPDVFVQHLKQMVQHGHAEWTFAQVSDKLANFEEELGLDDAETQDVATPGTVKKEATSPSGGGKSSGAIDSTSEADRWMSFHDATVVREIQPADSIVDLHTFALQLENFIFLHGMSMHQQYKIYERLEFDLVGKKNIRLRDATLSDKLYFMGSVVFGKKPKVIVK